MAVLQSCCFWKTVRKGCVASASYTLVYFGFSTLVMLIATSDDQEFVSGRRGQPVGESILTRGTITPALVLFHILFLICSIFLVMSSLLVFLGLKHHRRELLLPWIIFMLCDMLIELFHLIYLSVTQMVNFNPIVGFIFTIDLFIMCLNFYCLLCVISQYQNYQQGRGYAEQQMEVVLHPADSGIEDRQSQDAKMENASVSPFITINLHTHISTIPEETDRNHTIRASSATETPRKAAEDIAAINILSSLSDRSELN